MTVRLTTLLTIAAIFVATQTTAQNKHFKKALKEYEQESYTEAINHLKKIENPDAASRVLLAKALYQAYKYEEIESVLSGLTELDHDTRLALAMSYHRTEQYEKARAMWKTLLDDDDRAVIYNNIGDTFYGLEDIDSAIVYIKKALALDPYSDLYMLNLGLGYAAMEESGKACAYFFVSAQRKNSDASRRYESENCISW